MRIVIVSDVHANLAALEAVLRHAGERGPIDGVWCLGDSVGYGPQPAECIARLRGLDALAVAGNHDRAATGLMSTDEFNPLAAEAALWTRGRLSSEDAAYLDALPEVTCAPAGALEDDAAFTLVHGSLRWPLWEYIHSPEVAAAHLRLQRTPFSLFGHTHIPAVIVEGGAHPEGCDLRFLSDGEVVRLDSRTKLALNPGGVGQPRDGDPRTAYAVYDDGAATITAYRLEYDIAATQRLMEEAGLPRPLVVRLSLGR
jgi:predicted phosphodiesterase